MKYGILILSLLSMACKQSSEKENLQQLLANGTWIDLSHNFSAETIYWPNNPKGFQLDTQFNGTTAGDFYYSSYAFFSPEHGGTHLDAPVHFAKGKWSTDEIPLEKLTGEAVVIDVRAQARNNPDYQISISDITAWETKHGPIPANAIVLFHTGWSAFYPDAASYLGTAEKGEAATAKLDFPGIHPDLAAWMIKNRTIKAVGIDAASIDYGQSKDFKSHQLFYEKNIPGFENLTGLEALPASGTYVIALPMKIKGGSGGPLRMIAWVSNRNTMN
jgi:kynurenine formamidase